MRLRSIGKKLVAGIGYDIQKKPVATPLIFNYRRLAQFRYLSEVYDLIERIEGSVVECGVGQGYSFFMLCCLARYENRGRMVYGFDSFEGFPEPSEEDISPRNPQKGEWNVATIESITQKLVEVGGLEEMYVRDHVRLVKGFFEESLHKYEGGQIALLHLDVDLYKSYKVTLNHFWPLVAEGGVVLFDEYQQPGSLRAFPGAAKSIDEFFGPLTSEIRLNEQVNKYYLVKPTDA